MTTPQPQRESLQVVKQSERTMKKQTYLIISQLWLISAIYAPYFGVTTFSCVAMSISGVLWLVIYLISKD